MRNRNVCPKRLIAPVRWLTRGAGRVRPNADPASGPARALEPLEPRLLLSTYYIGPLGSDSGGAGTADKPWGTLAKAYRSMKGGDTLIVKNGSYARQDVFTHTTRPPSGSPEAGYTTVRAETPGGVVFDLRGSEGGGINVGGPASSPIHYVQIDGMVFRNQGSGAGLYQVDHVKITRSGFEDAAAGNGNTFVVGRLCSDVLVEDCFAWGSGHYKFVSYHAERVVFRRDVARFDRADANGEPIAAFVVYASNNVEVQNCISVDGDQSQFWTDVGEYSGSFSIPSTDGPSTNVNITGSIALNSDMQLMTLTKDLDNIRVTDTVGWHLRDGVWARDSAAFDHVTLGDLYGPGRTVPNVGMQYAAALDPVNSTSLRNSLLTGIKGTAVTGWASEDYNVFWGNTRDRSGTPTGAHSVTADPGLRYILRPDAASLIGKASDGDNIGATVTKRIGVTGTLWGEAGYNQVTGEDLWPFPNEDVIGTFMRSYRYTAPDGQSLTGDRGFAKAGQTLTNYIWTYLGAPNPYAAPSLPGDANRDGAVNFTDLLTLAKNYGQTGGMTFAQGDFNADGAVGFPDLLILAKAYNSPQSAAPVTALATALPSPSAAASLPVFATKRISTTKVFDV